jgi:predicted acetyltransferase
LKPAFEFLDIDLLTGEDFTLLLVEKEIFDDESSKVPVYNFVIKKPENDVWMGRISLRIGNTEDILLYAGHIGYGVDKKYRGKHYAAKACELLKPLALHHQINPVWVTCNPDNWASRKTCERIGGKLIEIVEIPEDHEMYVLDGETHKCRYRIDL